jgi:fluoride exporter
MSPSADDRSEVPFDPDVEIGPVGVRGARSRRGINPQAIIVISLAVGGALGAVARYSISLGLPTEMGRFPWGTFIENISGSFALGFLLILVIEQFPRGRLARPVIGTGFLGAYTTFSTFMVEAVDLVRDGYPGMAAAYLVASLIVGLVVVWVGMTSARVVVRAERWLQEELR